MFQWKYIMEEAHLAATIYSKQNIVHCIIQRKKTTAAQSNVVSVAVNVKYCIF